MFCLASPRGGGNTWVGTTPRPVNRVQHPGLPRILLSAEASSRERSSKKDAGNPRCCAAVYPGSLSGGSSTVASVPQLTRMAQLRQNHASFGLKHVVVMREAHEHVSESQAQGAKWSLDQKRGLSLG